MIKENTFTFAFVDRWVSLYHSANTLVRRAEDGVELIRHNNRLGRAFRFIGEPLLIRHEFLLGGEDKARWARYTAYRIDLWAKGEPDPEWYITEAERLKGQNGP